MEILDKFGLDIRLKKGGAFYVVSPWALTWDDENYYLVAYDAENRFQNRAAI